MLLLLDDMNLILQVYTPFENLQSRDIRLSPEHVAIKTNSAQCLKQLLQAFPQKPIHTHFLEDRVTGWLNQHTPSNVFSKTFTGLCTSRIDAYVLYRFAVIEDSFPTLTLLQRSALQNSVECVEVIY